MDKFILEFKKQAGEDCARKPMYLSAAAAEAMAAQLKNKERSIERLDDKGHFLELIDKYEIRGIRKIGENEGRSAVGPMVCEYGTRHPHKGKLGFEDCKCYDIYKILPMHFERLAKEMFGVTYGMDITEYMQRKIKETV